MAQTFCSVTPGANFDCVVSFLRSWSCAPREDFQNKGDKVRRLMRELHHDLDSQYPRLVLNNGSKQIHETKPRNRGVGKRHP
jgi:hypothetical protein